MFRIRFKTLRFVLLAYITIIIQASVLDYFSFRMMKPDLVLLLVIFFSLYNGVRRGIYCGIFLGLFVDALSAGILGINAFVLGLVGGVCGLLKERVYTTHLLTRVLVSFIAGIGSIIVYYILAVNFYQLPAVMENFGHFLGVIIYTTLINIIFVELIEKTVIVRQMTLL